MGAKLIKEVARTTNSELILFFLIVAVLVMIIAIPLSKQLNKNAMSKLEKYMIREAQIINVVQQNTRAITELTIMLQTNNNHCNECRATQLDRFNRIEDLLDEMKDIKERSAS